MLKDMTDEQKASMKVKHYTLHLPATMRPEQFEFIKGIAKCVLKNDPVTVVHEDAMRFLLRLAVQYRNVLFEFDEQNRWSDEDDDKINSMMEEFKPIIEYLQEEYKLDVSEKHEI